MNRRAAVVAAFAVACSFLFQALARPALAAGDAPSILVGLTRAVGIVVIPQNDAVFLWTDSSTGLQGSAAVAGGTSVGLSSTSAGVSWEFATPDGGVRVGQSRRPVYLGAPSGAEDTMLTVTGLRNPNPNLSGFTYRGSFVILPSAGVLLLANLVGAEDYVASVVGSEVPELWPLEVVKAQAIATRSYAVRKVTHGGASIFGDYTAVYQDLTAQDVKLWAGDQIYNGVVKENEGAVEATLATRGMILTYLGEPIEAYFHADAGGMTEDPCFVWGKSLLYLQPVEEVPYESKHSSWTVVLSEEDLQSGVLALGMQAEASSGPIVGFRPGVSGRWAGVLLDTADGVQEISATSFRGAFPQVKSLLFSSYVCGGGAPTKAQIRSRATVCVQSGDDGAIEGCCLASSWVVGDNGMIVSNPQGAFVLSGATEDLPRTYILDGRGWGHGVGLSQYGARQMALLGSSAQEILYHYYSGVALEEWWR